MKTETVIIQTQNQPKALGEKEMAKACLWFQSPYLGTKLPI